MVYHQLHMEIIDNIDDSHIILIKFENKSCKIKFTPPNKELEYLDDNELSQFIKLREFQLRKILHNKRKDSYFKGSHLNFVLHDGLPDTSFYDRSKITVLNNTNNQFIVNKTIYKSDNIPELYTDGSFNHEIQKGGFAFIIKTVEGNNLMYQFETTKKGNNLIELLAVIKGLEYLNNEKRIRIVTDSQYVIKGITEWLPLWKINNFYTANGTRAKNISEWKKVDHLIKNKYLEFEWVKAHTEHFENTICDLKAKSVYNEKNK